ncbi:MAG TPA: hypothetical protein VFE50_16690 [Cyclobacteriaceae bacterium]|nr:hypothetical protein [Cyclobacteriaceae bacterium]
MRRVLDADLFNESETVTIKIPVSVPYMPDQHGFEKVKGKFEHNGELYRLIRQKYAKDTLTVVCIRDNEFKKINQVLSEYAQSFSDVTGQTSTKLVVNFLKEYISLDFSILHSPGWTTTLGYPSGSVALPDIIPASIAHPPELQ